MAKCLSRGFLVVIILPYKSLYVREGNSRSSLTIESSISIVSMILPISEGNYF